VKGLPPKGAAICMEGWTIPREVVTFVKCRGCDYKGTKTEENQGQGFLSKGQLSNMWCGNCKEVWDWRDVMTRRVETTVLSHSTLGENKENSMEFLCELCYLLIHFSYLSMCMLK